MGFDPSTLTVASAVVTLVSGMFLLTYWRHVRDDWAAFGWGCANCVSALGLGFLALKSALPVALSMIVGPMILDICSIAYLVSALIFNHGPVRVRYFVLASVVWIATSAGLRVAGLGWLAAASGLALTGSLNTAAAVDFWWMRSERLRGRWPMIFVLMSRGFALVFLAADIFLARSASRAPWSGSGGAALVNFVGLIFAAGSAISLVTMSKERSEARYKAAALVDPLTGLANRRAFMDRAQRMLARDLDGRRPFALLAFDLDRFKSVNDRFGHPTGDHLLRIFADPLSRETRPTDLAGRIGGEEFVAALPGCAAEDAQRVGQRIRAAFEKDGQFVSGKSIGGTVSVGVAVAPDHGVDLSELIASADSALYRSKNSGRNRVSLAKTVSNDPDPDNLTRIA